MVSPDSQGVIESAFLAVHRRTSRLVSVLPPRFCAHFGVRSVFPLVSAARAHFGSSKRATSNPGRAVLTMRLVRVGLLNPPAPVVYAAVQEKIR